MGRARAFTGSVRNYDIGEGVTEETADAWIAAWEAQAAQEGLERGSAYWQAGWEWIGEQRKTRKLPGSSSMTRSRVLGTDIERLP